jgi:hypothetical protein
MKVEIGTEAPIFLFWEYLFRNFGVLSLQCAFALSTLLATPLLAVTVAGVSTVACIPAVPGILLLLVSLLFLVFFLLLASLLFLMALMLLQC